MEAMGIEPMSVSRLRSSTPCSVHVITYAHSHEQEIVRYARYGNWASSYNGKILQAHSILVIRVQASDRHDRPYKA